MNSRDLFKKTHSPYESRHLMDGVYTVSSREVGQVAGAGASLKAICSPAATEQDLWHVVHLDAGSRLLLDSVAVLGAAGQDQAAEWAMQDFGQHMGAVGVIGVASGSAIALRRVLDDGLQRGRVTQALLDSAGSRVTAHPVRWLDGVGIASHGGSMATLFLDMVRHDEDGLLLDAMTPADLMEGAEQGQFDALIVDYAHLEMMQNRLAAALSKVAANGLSVSGVTATKPFKRNGVAQVAVMFDFSDGQTFTAFFHNPDSTPAKLAPKDILTSWKFTLNKRDVTAVVQPEQGENVQMPKLASRIMQLVAKNSDRFKRANARKGEMAAQVQEVQARIDQKQAQLTELESDIADLQGRIDEQLKAKPVAAEPVSSQQEASGLKNGKAEEWHTDVPTEGLPELKEEKKKFYDFRLVINRLADDAVKAITRAQKLGNVSLYAYYMPSMPNTGRHGIVRLFPEDQNPGGNWKPLDPQVFHAGMVSDDQIRARLIEPLSRAPVLAHSQQSDTGNGAVSGGDPANQDELTDAQKIEMVDKAYQFASATDEFKIFAADSQIQNQNADDLTSLSVEAEYDPLSTAVAMDKTAKKNGFAVKWQMFTEPGVGDDLVARIYKGRKQIGRISMGGDGKAMVYVGASGDTRVTTPDGLRAVFSDDDAPYMIDWLANSLSKQDSSTVAADQAASQPDSTKPAAAPVDGGLSKDASEAIDNMLLALEADQQLMGRIEQAASRMDITDVSGDMVESWYRANSITYLSSLPMTQLMKAADEFKRQAVETVNRIGTVYGMSDRELYLLAMHLGYAEGTARNPDAVTKKALGEHPEDLDKAFAKLKKSPKPQQDDQEAQAVNPPTQEPVMNPDLDYLQSILDGDTDLSDGEAVEAELERIGENLTPELETLFEQAVDAYAAYQVQQASKIA